MSLTRTLQRVHLRIEDPRTRHFLRKEQVCREVDIQKYLRHRNTLKLYSRFHDEKRKVLILVFAGQGELYK